MKAICPDCQENLGELPEGARCPLCDRDSLIDEDAWETYEELHEIAYESGVERIAGRQERESA